MQVSDHQINAGYEITCRTNELGLIELSTSTFHQAEYDLINSVILLTLDLLLHTAPSEPWTFLSSSLKTFS
jgi:hypothetical protein